MRRPVAQNPGSDDPERRQRRRGILCRSAEVPEGRRAEGRRAGEPESTTGSWTNNKSVESDEAASPGVASSRGFLGPHPLAWAWASRASSLATGH